MTLPTISLAFECEGVPATFTVEEATLTEGLSKPFELEIVVRTGVMTLQPELVIGRSCHFTFDRGPLLRSVHGVVEELEIVGDSPMSHMDAHRIVKLKVVPAFKLLEHRKNSRIFQDMNVLQIVRDVLLPTGGHPEGLLAFGRTVDLAPLKESDYAPHRDFCVQYKESDFAFASRLLEEEGIAYHFEHMRVAHEVMVLCDSNLAYTPLETTNGAPFLGLTDLHALQGREGLLELSWKRVQKTDKTVLRHWDWLMPREGSESSEENDAAEAAEAPAVGAAAGLNAYEHSEERSREENEGDRVQRVHSEGGRRARVRHQREKAEEWIAHGKSNATGVAAGRILEHDGDGSHSVLVTAVKHRFDAEHENATYENEFEAVPTWRTYRPKKATKRPKIEGPQTAIVTGPEGEEIHTDDHGRIKILMHWDREQREEASPSAWVRVAQMLAGPGWGGWFLPRVGMEVVVQFLDGNPDKPLVTGCVYNGEHRTPYTLPDEKTKSTIKSSSSPGGEGFNELRFEDAAGAEEIFVHGQRDYNSRILRRHTMHVGENQDYDITGERTRHVGGSERVHVEGNQSITVDGGGTEGTKGIEVTVVETYKLSASKDIGADAPEKIELKCQGSVIEMTPGQIVFRAGDGAEIVLNADVLARSNDASEVKMDADITARASNGASLELRDTATLQDTNGSRVHLDSKITVESCDGAKTEHDQNVKTEGTEVCLMSDQTQLVLTSSSATLESATIDIAAEQSTQIEGGGGRGTFSGGRATLN